MTLDLAVSILGWATVLDGVALIGLATYLWCRRLWFAEADEMQAALAHACQERDAYRAQLEALDMPQVETLVRQTEHLAATLQATKDRLTAVKPGDVKP